MEPKVKNANHTSQKRDFEKGQYLGRLEHVKDNVARYGRIECVEFIPGWYEESLAKLNGIPIACAFWDVDLRESFVSCISALWADINPGAKIFLHDVDRTPVVDVFTDSLWWKKELGIDVPEFVGAFKGLGRLSPLLGYVTKCQSTSSVSLTESAIDSKH